MKHTTTAIYDAILSAKTQGTKLLAVLLDPDKIAFESLAEVIRKVNRSQVTHILIGGSHVENSDIDQLIATIKNDCDLPIVLFPGNPSQISVLADGILFLSLISGRNSDFLIGHQVKAAPLLKQSNLEIIPTGYILIESGKPTAVEKVSQTAPIARNAIDHVVATAQAGEMLGKKMIYLEAGSGADTAVSAEMIQSVSQNTSVPLIVGGGIRSKLGIERAHAAGADMVVIGTAFENDINFFE